MSQPFLLIGVCTRGRPELLERLLRSLAANKLPETHKAALLVVDNNPTPTVERGYVEQLTGFSVHVVHQPKAGLVNARNALFDAAETLGADWLIGIDDDEWVAPDWLVQWCRGIATGASQILVGRAELIHEDGGNIFRARRQFRDVTAGVPSRLFGTCNYAVGKSVFSTVEGLGLRFDGRFNTSGGEDAELMLRAKRKHNVVPYGWPYALAFEERTGPRAHLRYALRRSMQDRIVALKIARLHREMGLVRGHILLLAAKRTSDSLIFGCGRLALGIIRLPLGRQRFGQDVGLALEHFARVLAVIPFLAGKDTVTYGPTGV